MIVALIAISGVTFVSSLILHTSRDADKALVPVTVRAGKKTLS